MDYNKKIKLQRSGFTETNLIFIRSLPQDKITKELLDLQQLDINRLYSKAGFYDKKISGSYFDIDVNQVMNSDIYNKFMSLYEESLFDCDYLILMSQMFRDQQYFKYKHLLHDYWNKFHHNNAINTKLFRYWTDNYGSAIYDYLVNKKVLVINSFGSLIHQQYESGNTHKIFPSFPHFRDLTYIDFPYTFFNSGPHDNFFETLDYYYDLITKQIFDVALVSCGPYGCILVDKIVKLLDRSAITMGSGITPMFGIDPNVDDLYWINNIPEKYIPQDYKKIEHGRYWRKIK